MERMFGFKASNPTLCTDLYLFSALQSTSIEKTKNPVCVGVPNLDTID